MVTSINGGVKLIAGNDIQLNVGVESHSVSRDTVIKSDGLFNSTKTTTHYAAQDSNVVGTLLAGNVVTVAAGHDLNATAAALNANRDVLLTAGNNIVLLAGQQISQTEESRRQSGGFSGLKWSNDQGLNVTSTGTQINAGNDITIKSGGTQIYQATDAQSGGDTTLFSGGGIAFLTATDVDHQSRTSGKHNIVWQASDNSGHVDTTEKQSTFTAGGDWNLVTTGNILVQVGQESRETADQVINRATTLPGQSWISTLQKDPYVTWQDVSEQHDVWHEHHEGVTPALSAVITAVAAYFTAGAASALIGTASGAAAGSGAALAAAGSGATGAAVSAGWANATLAGVAAGSIGGSTGAIAQGNDWRTPALYGAVTGGLTGYLSAGTYYNNPITGAKELSGYIVNGQYENIGEFALHYATTNAMARLEAKLADKVGLNSQQLNWLLMVGSIVGNAETTTRYKSPSQGTSSSDFDQTGGAGVRGYFNRGLVGLPFDTIDLLLGYQGLPDASSASVLYNKDLADINQPITQNLTCHSLGTVTCSYLGWNGLVNGNIYLASVPFMVAAPPNATTLLGNGDAVNGFSGGAIFNWNATIVPIQFLTGHPFDNYKKYIDDAGAKK
ncbi:hemagglutinin repeat-containing protein [Dyella jejuensis]